MIDDMEPSKLGDAAARDLSPEPEPEKPALRQWAIIDESPTAKIQGQLLDWEKRECLAAEHVRSPGRFPVPLDCDLALKRYRLFKKPNGRETFVAIHHGKDAGAENEAGDVTLTLADLARMLMAQDASGHLDLDPGARAKLTAYLNSFDA